MDNLGKMDRCLEKFNLQRPNQEGIEIMNKLITKADIETGLLCPWNSPGKLGHAFRSSQDLFNTSSVTIEKPGN